MKPQIIILGIVLLFAKTLYAQDEPLASKRVYPVSLPIEVSNTVGGTHIDSYVVHLKKGQKLHVQVENKTDDSKVFFDTVLAGTERRFGNDSTENSWSGVVPESGDYEIRLGAYPAANYKLMVYLTRARADEPKTAFDHRVSDSTAPAYTYSRRRRGKQSAHKPIHSTPTRRRIAKKHCEA
jgi:hypothetical protein